MSSDLLDPENVLKMESDAVSPAEVLQVDAARAHRSASAVLSGN